MVEKSDGGLTNIRPAGPFKVQCPLIQRTRRHGDETPSVARAVPTRFLQHEVSLWKK